MDIFDYALQMEKDGEQFYREIAKKTCNKGLQTILTMLANEEFKHYQAIESMRQNKYQMTETNVLDDVRNIFIKIKDQEETFEPDQEQAELYARAQEIEKKSQQCKRHATIKRTLYMAGITRCKMLFLIKLHRVTQSLSSCKKYSIDLRKTVKVSG
ncbi:ferritin family protein [Planctomycetota bacterium]